MTDEMLEELRAELRAQYATHPDGWVLVPFIESEHFRAYVESHENEVARDLIKQVRAAVAKSQVPK